VVSVGVGDVVSVGVGPVVALALAVVVGLAVVPELGAVVSIGIDEAASATTCGGPNGVKARATETTRATERAGYATTERSRIRRALSLFVRFTGNSLGLLIGAY